MANKELLQILVKGVNSWNQWRQDNPDKVLNLTDAYLTGAHLTGADLRGAHLTGAHLSDANLNDVVIFDADLRGTNLTNADLTRSRFIDCNLRDAVVENARVTNIDIQRLRGLPKPPAQLRIEGSNGEVLLTDFEAREFFHLPSIVEVYLTRELTQQELGCYHFHLGEMHHEGVATDVYFVGHRLENGGSVLRFQATSYETIYHVLPDLLAPFRMAGAIDWKQTIQSIPAEDRGEAITALAAMEPRPAVVEWRFARRMAETFEGYRNANVDHLSRGGSRRVRIEIFENLEEVQQLSQVRLPEPWDGKRPLVITQGPESNLFIGGWVAMSNHAEVHGDAIGSAVGSGTVNARDITVYKNAVDGSSRLDNDIKQKLKEARDAIENAELSDADKADVIDDLTPFPNRRINPSQIHA
jgi:uncharacterized protein YjbI with pentapeptide repeats